MKILYVTPNKFDNSGGGVCAENLYLGLKRLNLNLNVYSPNDIDLVSIKNKKNDIVSRILGHSNYMYLDWRNKRNKIINKKYDVIFLSNSRLGFIAEDLKKNGYKGKIITHYDNIEFDYCDEYSKKFNGLKKKAFLLIEKRNIVKDEKLSIKYSDMSIFLTQRDKKRAEELYGFKGSYRIIPITLKESNINLTITNDKINILFIGSLWYPPNVEAVLWFVNEVWKNEFSDNKNLKLIIAGSRPTDEILKLKYINNVEIVSNFEEVVDFVPKDSIFISPIINGAGMKVKIAEALSMGIPIIASTESLVGYEEVKEYRYVTKADTSEEYIKAIYNYIDKINIDNRYIKNLFNKYYSLERCTAELNKIIKC